MKSLIFLSVLLCLFTTACEPGVKKENGQAVSDEALKTCHEIEQDLKAYGISLQGPSPEENEKTATLPAAAKNPSVIEDVTNKLETYITTAERVLRLADNRLVKFDQGTDLTTRSTRAAKYLAQIYAKMNFTLGAGGKIKSPSVDKFEVEARFVTYSSNLRALDSLGVKTDSAVSADALKSKKPRELNRIISLCDSVASDGYRIKFLLDRNQYFKIDGYKKLSEALEPIGGYYWRWGQAAKQVLSTKNAR